MTQTMRPLDRIKRGGSLQVSQYGIEKGISNEDYYVLPRTTSDGNVHITYVCPGANPHFRGSEV